MKPREFDELVKQKFDQNDFEYNPGNWAKLADELDGRSTKRGMVMGWMPLMGIAASIVMAFGMPAIWQLGSNAPLRNEIALHNMVAKASMPANLPLATEDHSVTQPEASTTIKTPSKHTKYLSASTIHGNIIATNNITLAEQTTQTEQEVAVAGSEPTMAAPNKTWKDSLYQFGKKKKKLNLDEPITTFRHEKLKLTNPKTAIILSGGFNFGNQSNGYSFGATARRMINKRVYVEGGIAFTGATNNQKVQYTATSASRYNSSVAENAATAMNTGFAAKNVLTSKNSSGESSYDLANGGNGSIQKTADRQYNLYYAQVTPTIGYKVLNRLSVGIGPDFQQMLVDSRPEASTTERGNIKEVPTFDVGFMGKTEFSFTKNVKAAVYYREGINNVLTPTNKYIDRNYLQIQLKCAILNK